MRFLSSSERQKSGFTLIEIAIVITIIGLLVAGFAQAYQAMMKKNQISEVEKTYDSAQEAMRNFILSDPNPLDGLPETESRYPCPASSTAAPTSADFGQEFCPTVSAGSCENGVCVRSGTGGQLVFVGALPTRTLGVSSQVAIDPYGNRLTYAVSVDLTSAGSLSGGATPPGAITIDPTMAGTPITDAHFAIITHGEDGAGSYTYEGAQHPNACRFGEDGDAENCDNDARFSELERSVGSTTEFYDDSLAFTLSDGSADQYWGPISNNPQNIHNMNETGLVWVGPSPDATTYVGDRFIVNGITRLLGALNVAGVLTADSDINAAGNMTAQDANFRDITASRDITANRDITATGNVTAAGDVNGRDVNANRDLNVTNNATIQENLTIQNGIIDTTGGKIETGKMTLGGSGNVATEPDIEIHKRGLLTTDSHFYINIDSDNSQTDAHFAIRHNKNLISSSSITDAGNLFLVDESGNSRLKGHIGVANQKMFLGKSGDVATAPDIEIDKRGLLTTQRSFYINIDSDNSQTDAHFAIRHNKNVISSSSVSDSGNLFLIDENGDTRIKGHIGVANQKMFLGKSSNVADAPDIEIHERGLLTADSHFYINIDSDNNQNSAHFAVRHNKNKIPSSDANSSDVLFLVDEKGDAKIKGNLDAPNAKGLIIRKRFNYGFNSKCPAPPANFNTYYQCIAGYDEKCGQLGYVGGTAIDYDSGAIEGFCFRKGATYANE